MSLFDHPAGALRLDRYPPGAANDALQAWDAADEYLLQACPPPQAMTGPTLIFNDAFGALACALHARAPFCVSDSYLSQLATRHNLGQNTLAAEPITLLDSLAPLPPAPGLVLMKIPKTLALLEQQLHALRQVMGPPTRPSLPPARCATFIVPRWRYLATLSGRPTPRWRKKRRALSIAPGPRRRP